MLPLNTGDCLIEVTTCAGSTVFAAALFFCLLSVERVKVYHRSVFVVAIGYIVNHLIYSLFLAHLAIGQVSICHG
jgi:hypothetical protein